VMNVVVDVVGCVLPPEPLFLRPRASMEEVVLIGATVVAFWCVVGEAVDDVSWGCVFAARSKVGPVGVL